MFPFLGHSHIFPCVSKPSCASFHLAVDLSPHSVRAACPRSEAGAIYRLERTDHQLAKCRREVVWGWSAVRKAGLMSARNTLAWTLQPRAWDEARAPVLCS